MFGALRPLLLVDTHTQVLLNFQALVERKFDTKIIALQSDWGGEYEKLNSFFQNLGISHHVSYAHAHQQNGSAERKYRHIVEVGLALLAGASMPLKFWDEAFLTAVHIINMLPSRVINNETPMERLLHTKPDYSSLRVFGCACWPNLCPYNNHKLMFRSKQCVFLGYSAQHKGVKCLDVSTGHVYISRDVVFDETKFPFSDLHPNAGALLRKEILLLPSSFTGLDQGENDCDDQILANSHNCLLEPCDDVDENHGDNSVEISKNGEENSPTTRHFMCPRLGDRSSSGLALQESSNGSPSGSTDRKSVV